MATVNFYLRTEHGKAIHVRIRIGRKMDVSLSTKIKIADRRTDWDSEMKMPRDPKKVKFLEVLRRKILTYIDDVENDLTKSVSDLTSDDFKKIIYDIHKVPEKDQTFKRIDTNLITNYIDHYIAKCKKTGYKTKGKKHKQYAPASLQKPRQLKLIIEQFEKERGVSLYLNSFDSEQIQSFESYLLERFADSNAGRLLRQLKTILRRARKEKKEVNPDFLDIEGISYDIIKIVLTEDEQELIFATPMPNEILEYAKDWLLVLCGTGQRAVDCLSMTKDNITKDGFIEITQLKTGADVKIPLLNRVKRIIEKYDGFPPRFSDNDESQKTHLNKKIKEVCKICGIDKMIKVSKNGVMGTYPKYELITTRTGRKSLATWMYKDLEMSAQNCMAITGHKQLENFFVYVGGENSTIDKTNKELFDKINKKTVAKRSSKLKIS